MVDKGWIGTERAKRWEDMFCEMQNGVLDRFEVAGSLVLDVQRKGPYRVDYINRIGNTVALNV